MKLSKSLGQVFLKDKNYIQRILSFLDTSGETVLEIGSGPGEISAQIAEKCKFLYCVEFDPRLITALEQRFGKWENVKVIHADILKFDISGLSEKIVVFGNVPYQISNPLIEYLVKSRNFIKKAYLTFQKEFIDRIIAENNSKNYGFMSCYAQYYAQIKKVFDIPKGAFMPAPKVNSSFIALEFYCGPLNAAKDEGLLFTLIRKAFNQRRKKIANSLSEFITVKDFFSSLKIDPNLRPENISLKQYVDIANCIYAGRLKED